MNKVPKILSVIICILTVCVASFAQTEEDTVTASGNFWKRYGYHLSGSVQSDILVPQEDETIGTGTYDDKVMTNTYADVNLTSRHFDAGIRFEYLQHPLPGYDNDFKGWGVPMAYARLHYDRWDVTVGSIYEQFGSGFVLRTYEDRSLGIDNQLRGARVTLSPIDGLRIKVLSGQQRRYWHTNSGLVSGADAEYDIHLNDRGGLLTLGASWVNKYEPDEDIMVDPTHRLNLPLYVNAFDVRANLQMGPVSLLAEYAWKSQDPTEDNDFNYRYGNVAMLSASYSKRGMSLLLQAKRSDNMSMRSKRSILDSSSQINHFPIFTTEHTYALLALYPYATQLDGEWALQAQAAYNFRKNTVLGGKYGTDLKANVSYVAWHGEEYYHDVNVQMEKRLSRSFLLNAMYMNQAYNKTVIEGDGGMLHANIIVLEGKNKFSRHFTLRGELQYLFTKDDEGDWFFALLEASFAPHWMVTVDDQWNCGTSRIHYYNGSVTYSIKSHRLQLSYGRTQAGYNCSGGVCRFMPATRGLRLSYNYNF